MSNPSQNRPRKGGASSRAIRTWKDSFHGFVHSVDTHNLPTTNLPRPTESRFPTSLNATLCLYPHLETVYVEDYSSDDCQIATQPVNRPAAVIKIAGEKFNPVDIGSGLIQ
jgi:hypothetical protein